MNYFNVQNPGSFFCELVGNKGKVGAPGCCQVSIHLVIRLNFDVYANGRGTMLFCRPLMRFLIRNRCTEFVPAVTVLYGVCDVTALDSSFGSRSCFDAI